MVFVYLYIGLVFKLADGALGPWGGSDEFAAKAAGHDFKGAAHYFNCGLRDLNIPLMMLIDYKGFRMTVSAYLPVGKDTIVYGSNDGGRTVWNKSSDMHTSMQTAAKKLNLRNHKVGDVYVSILCFNLI